jgi:hypothetical protein
MQQMQRRGASQLTATLYDPHPANERYNFQPIRTMKRFGQMLVRSLTWLRNLQDSAARSDYSDTATEDAATRINVPPLRILYLLACMHKTQRRKHLVQDRIETIERDRALFCFMGRQLNHLHSHAWTLLRFRTVIGIHFTKVSRWFPQIRFEGLRFDDTTVPPTSRQCGRAPSTYVVLQARRVRLHSRCWQLRVRMHPRWTTRHRPADHVSGDDAHARTSSSDRRAGKICTESTTKTHVWPAPSHWRRANRGLGSVLRRRAQRPVDSQSCGLEFNNCESVVRRPMDDSAVGYTRRLGCELVDCHN